VLVAVSAFTQRQVSPRDEEFLKIARAD
jgi:hypothetical protein